MKVILLILIAYSFIYADLFRNGNSVSDSTTNLQWQDNEDVNTTTRTWTNAIDYCDTLTLDEASDWRLPNKKELLSIADHSQYNPAIDTNAFVNTASSYYWSSTTNANYTFSAWNVNFYGGYSSSYGKSNNHYVRCVRGGQFDDLNPSAKDFDDDGIANDVDIDDDNDGMPDVFEHEYGLNQYDALDAIQDRDEDGYTNLQEYNAGTNPRDALDFPKISSPAVIMYLLN